MEYPGDEFQEYDGSDGEVIDAFERAMDHVRAAGGSVTLRPTTPVGYYSWWYEARATTPAGLPVTAEAATPLQALDLLCQKLDGVDGTEDQAMDILKGTTGYGLDEFQTEIAARWGSSSYSAAHNAREAPLNHADHALKHLVKVVGKIAAVLEAYDHADPLAELAGPLGKAAPTPFDVARHMETLLADLEIYGARLAEVNPVMRLRLGAAVAARIAAKFPEVAR